MYCLLVSSFGAPSPYSDRVVCCPSNRWTLSIFLQKFENLFGFKNDIFRNLNKEDQVLFYFMFPKHGPVVTLNNEKDFLNNCFLKLIRNPIKSCFGV